MPYKGVEEQKKQKKERGQGCAPMHFYIRTQPPPPEAELRDVAGGR
ncbi:MAG: hypothetical protein K0S27_1122 [Gammaproteobacteria bacterium]|jgi:hypothetical protein|nr:hypothetical protein [Gammaproteobacteria bacterium]